MIRMLRTWIRALARRSPKFRKLVRFILYRVRKIFYRLSGMIAGREERMILFVSFNGKAYSDTPKAVYEYMLSDRRYADYEFVWAFREPERYAFLEENPRTKVTLYQKKLYRRALLKAKYWVTNYRVPDEIWPAADQRYVQCWHGTPLKCLGYDISRTGNAMNSLRELRIRYERDARKISYLLSPSPFTTEKFTSAWNLKEFGKKDVILEIGYPRNDRLALAGPEDGRAIRQRLGLPAPGEKKVILYAPTWRDDQYDPSVGYVYDLKIDFNRLKQALGEEYILLFRVHYLVKNAFDFGRYDGFIRDVSDHDDINDLYLASDLLLTDYSSVMFDYAILKKPMIFYLYDLEEYAEKTRGLYFDIREVPGTIVEAEQDLASAILNAATGFQMDEKYRRFRERFTSLDDGQASRRLAEAVFEVKP